MVVVGVNVAVLQQSARFPLLTHAAKLAKRLLASAR